MKQLSLVRKKRVHVAIMRKSWGLGFGTMSAWLTVDDINQVRRSRVKARDRFDNEESLVSCFTTSLLTKPKVGLKIRGTWIVS